MALTIKTKKILVYIHDFIKEQGIAPSYQDILTHMGGKSRGSMKATIDRLIRDGYLAREDFRARGLKVLKMPPDHDEPSIIQAEHTNLKFKGMDIFVSERIPENTLWVNPATLMQGWS